MRAVWGTLAAAILAIGGPVWAVTLSVTPIRLVLSPAAPRGTFTVINESPGPVRAQLTLNQWKQVDGQDVLTPVRDVLVNPTIFEMPANGRQLVRLGLAVPADNVERSYRLVVDEIPSAEQLKSGGVGMKLRISVPLFVPADGAAADLSWTMSAKGTAARFVITNKGRRHAQITSIKITRGKTVIGQGSASTYILPGATMPAEIKLTAPATPGETLRIDAVTDNGDVQTTVRATAS